MTDKIFSQDSGIAPYETFFHSFYLEAFAFFNYWTSDESTNDTLELENRDINDMPRFVKLAWNIAPDLEEQKAAYEKLNPPNLYRISDAMPVQGATDQFIVDGVRYSPDQLRPPIFSQIVNALANSDISPGVIQTIVTLPLVSSGIVNSQPPFKIDLDSWFTNDRSRGVPVSDVRNSFWNRTSGYFNLPKLYKSNVSPKNNAAFNEMFAGQFSVAPRSFLNSSSKISAVNPSSPALSMNSNTASTIRPRPVHPSEQIYNEVGTAGEKPNEVNSVKVSFVDTGIGGVVQQSRLNVATDAAHVNAIAATAQVLKNLVAYSESGLQSVKRKITLKSFDAPNGLASRQYVGYIIEKYEQVNGVFTLKEIIGISDPYMDEYYDTKIRYGAVYRYRIRSIMRWIRPKNVTAEGTDYTISSKMTSARPDQNTSSVSLTPNFASYFGSEWSKNWATAHIIDEDPPNPPDQLQVRPYSKKAKIIVTFQLPENKQRDIYKMTLYRRIIDKNGREIETWKALADFDMETPGYYEDTEVSFVPAVPNDLGFEPAAPFRYVYAATSLSIHNGESSLSEQIGARINSDWEARGEYPVEFYSSRGVSRTDDHGVFSTIPMRSYKTHIVVTPKNTFDEKAPAEVILMGQERWGSRMLNGNQYILRIHSLDTGESFDVDFSTRIDSVEPEHISAPSNIYVPSVNEQYVYDSQALTSG